MPNGFGFDFDFGPPDPWRDFGRGLAEAIARSRRRPRRAPAPAPLEPPRTPQPGVNPSVGYSVTFASALGPIRDMPWARDLLPIGSITAGLPEPKPVTTRPKPSQKLLTWDIPKVEWPGPGAGGPRRSSTGSAKKKLRDVVGKVKKFPGKIGRGALTAAAAATSILVPAGYWVESKITGEEEADDDLKRELREKQRHEREVREEAREIYRAQQDEMRAAAEEKRAQERHEAAMERARAEKAEAEAEKKRKDEAAASAAAAASAPAKPFWRQIFDAGLNYKLEQLKARALRPSIRISLSDMAGPVPADGVEPMAESQTLTSFYSVGVPSGLADGCECPPKKKRKPKAPRDVCYSGTYIERADGLSKTKKRKVPCRPFKGKPRS